MIYIVIYLYACLFIYSYKNLTIYYVSDQGGWVVSNFLTLAGRGGLVGLDFLMFAAEGGYFKISSFLKSSLMVVLALITDEA